MTLLLFTTAAQSGSTGPVIVAPTAGEKCVAPNDVMRTNHMKFLIHQRDDTVRSGIRGARYSLAGCIGCHVQKDSRGAAIPVNARGQFCASCHSYLGVRIDCFECHATVPDAARLSTAVPLSTKADPAIRANGNVRGAHPAWISSSLLSSALCRAEENS